MKQISKYREAIKNFDRGQLLNEFNHLLDQQEQVWAGTRSEIDYPENDKPRRAGRKLSVGPAIEPKPEREVIRRKPDGSPVYRDSK